MIGFIITLSAVGLGIFLAKSMPDRKPGNKEIPEETIAGILSSKVAYYQSLPAEEQSRFRNEVLEFLQEVNISGVNLEVTDEDEVLVAASAIIPIFSFPGWKYPNLHEVLLYPDLFDERFSLDEENNERHVMGMVGSGAMNHVMILSRPALHEGFSNKSDKNNTAIHEFVHLLDKTDGEIDGVPELLTGREYTKPWLQLMQKQIATIKGSKSDINPYGASSETEFFAVASEYFFERPMLLQQKHPELYAMMEEIFKQAPRTDSRKHKTTLTD